MELEEQSGIDTWRGAADGYVLLEGERLLQVVLFREGGDSVEVGGDIFEKQTRERAGRGGPECCR